MLLLLIDGLNLIRRVHAAVPVSEDTAAYESTVVESCLRSIRRALSAASPSHAVCAFDGAGESWRHQLHAGYKADRPAMPESLSALLPRIEAAIDQLGVRTVRVPSCEADDVIAAIAMRVAARGGEALILSTDKSMLSLLQAGIRVRHHFDDRELDAAYVQQRFGVVPAQLPTLLALVGERSLGIPGVPSVGAKTAARLIAEHGDLESILAASEQIAGRLGERLHQHANDARLSLRLSRLRTELQVGINLKDCRVAPPATSTHP